MPRNGKHSSTNLSVNYSAEERMEFGQLSLSPRGYLGIRPPRHNLYSGGGQQVCPIQAKSLVIFLSIYGEYW